MASSCGTEGSGDEHSARRCPDTARASAAAARRNTNGAPIGPIAVPGYARSALRLHHALGLDGEAPPAQEHPRRSRESLPERLQMRTWPPRRPLLPKDAATAAVREFVRRGQPPCSTVGCRRARFHAELGRLQVYHQRHMLSEQIAYDARCTRRFGGAAGRILRPVSRHSIGGLSWMSSGELERVRRAPCPAAAAGAEQ